MLDLRAVAGFRTQKPLNSYHQHFDASLTILVYKDPARIFAKGLARAINEVAAEIDADLIVLKTHGRHGITHLILGSVAEEVVRSAPCAVLSLTPTACGR
jgi:nucleotide-binding universal stress UspA family protein